MVKNPPAKQETRVQSLRWTDPLEMEMTTHSSILAWKIPQAEEPSRLKSLGHKESEMTEHVFMNAQHVQSLDLKEVKLMKMQIIFCFSKEE